MSSTLKVRRLLIRGLAMAMGIVLAYAFPYAIWVAFAVFGAPIRDVAEGLRVLIRPSEDISRLAGFVFFYAIPVGFGVYFAAVASHRIWRRGDPAHR